MLEHPRIRRYSSTTLVVDSDNPTGADNQQERPRDNAERAESSETICQTSESHSEDDMARSAWRHAEPSGNDLAFTEAVSVVPNGNAEFGDVTSMNGPKVAKFLVG